MHLEGAGKGRARFRIQGLDSSGFRQQWVSRYIV